MTAKEISQLVRKVAAGEASPGEIQALEAWYRSVHQQDEVVWPVEDASEPDVLKARILARLDKKLAAGSVVPIPKEQLAEGAVIEMPGRRRIQRGWMAAAACLLLIVAAWLVIQRQTPSPQQFVTIDNPSGSIRQIVLPDHSLVWLNAGSELQYAENFSGDRSIRLQGEAIFDVTEDKRHPFVVRAGDLQTTVLGTRFNVRSFAEEQESDITVLQGKVRVDNAGKALDVLTPARQLQWDRQQQAFKTLTVDTAVVTAWQQGRLQFNGQTMDVIAGVLARWYKMHFNFRDSAVRHCRVYAQFKSDTPLEEVLSSMSLVLEFKYIIDDKQRIVTLYGKGCVPSPQ